MNGANLAIAISVVSLAAQGLNAWLNSRMRAELAELKLEISKQMGAEFVRHEVFGNEIKRVEQACVLRHGANA